MGNERILGHGVLGEDFARRKEHFVLSHALSATAVQFWDGSLEGMALCQPSAD